MLSSNLAKYLHDSTVNVPLVLMILCYTKILQIKISIDLYN